MGRRKPRLCRGQSTAHVLSDIDPRYATIENVFLTPHPGSATEARAMPRAFCCSKVFTLLKPARPRGTAYADFRCSQHSRNAHQG